ncbi:hypothetical protein U9M48_038419, partial [Paspalum notatum var. saurae]
YIHFFLQIPPPPPEGLDRSCSRSPPCVRSPALRDSAASGPVLWVFLGIHRNHYRSAPGVAWGASSGKSIVCKMTIDQLWVVIATQINDLYKFPLQPDLDRDDGKYLAPYPDLNMRNPFTLQRYKFDNAQITKEDTKKALENHYVFDEEFSTAQFRQLWEVSNKMHNAEAKLFSGSELGLELWPLPTEKSMENILLYNPEEGEFSGEALHQGFKEIFRNRDKIK